MKTLSEIRRDIVSFYSTIQQKINDFSFGSVISGIFYSVSAALENVYREVQQIENQAYIATASGEYLDRLIEGTFQLERESSTRSVGYVTLYADSPIQNDITLNYADFNLDTGTFTSSTSAATKFVGFPSEGDEGIVFVLTQPESSSFEATVDTENKTITLPEGTQYAILRVASSQTGEVTNLNEGKINSFPSAPTGISGVINTSNPGLIFSTNEEYTGGAPYSVRFTTIRNYNENTGVFEVDNAFNFSNSGFIEINKDVFNNPVSATYLSDDNTSLSRGLIFQYSSRSTSTITLNQPIVTTLPVITNILNGVEKTYTLESYSFGATSVDLSDIQKTVFKINVDVSGSSYDPNNPPNVTISGGNGSGATAVANITSGGAVGSITVTNPGSGYTAVPTITIDAPPSSGTTATATAVIGTTSVFLNELSTFVQSTPSLVANELRTSISSELVFDPDAKLSETNTLQTGDLVSGGSNQATDNEYRTALQNYLSSLGKATNSSLVTGALRVDGITFARVLPNFLSPKGSSTVVAANSDGFLPQNKITEIKNELNTNWKASGINIIVKGPERQELHVSLSVKLFEGATQSSVTQEILSQTQNYFNSLSVGQTVSYSDLIILYNSILDVENVFNIIITKRLQNETYEQYKENYDEEFLTDLTKTQISDISSVGKPSNPADYEVIFDTVDSNYYVYDPNVSSWQLIDEANPTYSLFADSNQGHILVYNTQNQQAVVYGDNVATSLNDYQNLNFGTGQYVNLGLIYAQNTTKEIIKNAFTQSNMITLYNFYRDLVGRFNQNSSVVTTSQLRSVLETYKSSFPVTETEFYYILSYLFSEPIDKELMSDYPIDPASVLSQNLQNYTASETEIYKLGTFTYNGVVRPSVGINYL